MNTLLALTGVAVLTMISEMLRYRKAVYPIIIGGLAVAFGLAVYAWGNPSDQFRSMIYFDNYAIVFSALIVMTTLLWFILSGHFIRSSVHAADYSALIIFSLAGGVVMVSYTNLTMLFLGIEILSVSMYVMSASNKTELRSNEAGFKYFIMGAFATGFLLFGMALIYGVTGSFSLEEISAFASANQGKIPMLFYSGILLLITGLGFKVSAVPFHYWAPDVYEGAPSPVTGFMSTVVKTAAFAALLRLFENSFATLSDWWVPVMAVLSAATMLTGNITALYQVSIKRLMAYSSIAHAGYMLLAVVAVSVLSASALFIYAVAYSVASLGVFALIIPMTNNKNETIGSLHGFAKTHPRKALFLSVCLLSLAGIPPVAGFFGKYYTFVAALQEGHLLLVLLAVISSVIGVYYYFSIIIAMYKPSDNESVAIIFNNNEELMLWIAFLVTLAIGMAPGFLIGLI